MRLIDADAVDPAIVKWIDDADDIRFRQQVIDDIPTIDAVPVIRCKDCKHYHDGVCEQINYIMDGYYHGTFEMKEPFDFCSCGEKTNRKEESP